MAQQDITIRKGDREELNQPDSIKDIYFLGKRTETSHLKRQFTLCRTTQDVTKYACVLSHIENHIFKENKKSHYKVSGAKVSKEHSYSGCQYLKSSRFNLIETRRDGNHRSF